jgi:hypothetical protein
MAGLDPAIQTVRFKVAAALCEVRRSTSIDAWMAGSPPGSSPGAAMTKRAIAADR